MEKKGLAIAKARTRTIDQNNHVCECHLLYYTCTLYTVHYTLISLALYFIPYYCVV